MSARRHGLWLSAALLLAAGTSPVRTRAQQPTAAASAQLAPSATASATSAAPAATDAPSSVGEAVTSPAPTGPAGAPSASTPAASRAPVAEPELTPLAAEPGATDEPAAPAADGFGVDEQLGFGVGTTHFERPLADGTEQVLPPSAFAALDAGLRVHLPSCGRLSLSAALRYRSSLGYRVEQSPLFALSSAQDVRVQRVELSASARWRIGHSAWSPALGVELGVEVASFVPELHDRLAPKYALAGPLLRPFGRLEPFDWLALQLGPELTFIALVDGTLGEDGAGDQGLGVGAEASVRARLFSGLALELDTRGSKVVVKSDGDRADFQDTEHYFTLGLVGEL